MKFVDIFPGDKVDEVACVNSDNNQEGEDVSHNCIRQSPLICLPVISSAFS